ncbi:MAG: pilus assembly protein [Alphaproteobacteria bacterium]|nr:pilus assembly protein [Alphaproteobacteria bacterium]MBV9063379.1 pilus assembly protein [Alphaproteobacteria bacterium]
MKTPKFIGAKDGTVAIEFAFIAPILILLFLGTIELCNALICRQKVTTVAASAADLVAQNASTTASQINDVFSALNAIVYPYPSSGAKIVITSIKEDPNHVGQYVVAWSRAQNTLARTKNASITVPAGLVTSGASVIFAEISYTYTPPSNRVIKVPFTMSDSFYARPRQSALVDCPDC